MKRDVHFVTLYFSSCIRVVKKIKINVIVAITLHNFKSHNVNKSRLFSIKLFPFYIYMYSQKDFMNSMCCSISLSNMNKCVTEPVDMCN